jgi:hypothetical protein
LRRNLIDIPFDKISWEVSNGNDFKIFDDLLKVSSELKNLNKGLITIEKCILCKKVFEFVTGWFRS